MSGGALVVFFFLVFFGPFRAHVIVWSEMKCCRVRMQIYIMSTTVCRRTIWSLCSHFASGYAVDVTLLPARSKRRLSQRPR